MPILRSFYFVRHGETDWNFNKRVQGHTDIPLNATGRAQAEAAQAIMRNLPVDRVVSSTLGRAVETAEILNRHLGLPHDREEFLRERHFGAFEGLDITAIEEQRKQMMEKGFEPEENGYPCPPGGETYGEFKQRTIEGINKSLSLYAGQNVLFVSHGGVYRVLRRSLFDSVDMSPNVQIFHFENAGGQWHLHRLSA